MLIPELLLQILEELLEADFKRFKWYLTMEVSDSCTPMARAVLENASREDAVDRMIQRYGAASAAELAAEILRRMSMNDAAQKLTSAYAAGGKTSASPLSSSSSSSSSAAAPAAVSGVVVAPQIVGSTTGTLNITINRA